MSRKKKEFGDFQTPPALACQVVTHLRNTGLKPVTVIEPTCGEGTLLHAALREFPTVRQVIGLELNADHLTAATHRLSHFDCEARLIHGDFFKADWQRLLADVTEPVLIVGNPPWVTNSALGAIGSANLPKKRNANGTRGIDAVTGASNFDVSEFMISRMLEILPSRRGTLAMLCKTSVARRLLKQCWIAERPFDGYQALRINASVHFAAAVDACLFVVSNFGAAPRDSCDTGSLENGQLDIGAVGWRNKRLVADVVSYDQCVDYYRPSRLQWRSGIKHDCAAVIELQGTAGLLQNGFGESVEIEDEFLYPMLKSSSLLSGFAEPDRRWMLVTQRRVGDATSPIETRAPKTWEYLMRHRQRLDDRASRIYRGRPRFSMFGIGAYTFLPWKVAVSGFAKQARFELVAPYMGKPVVLDDTCYFIGFENEQDARQAHKALNSPTVLRAIEALIFRDSKRPITATLLNQIDPTPSLAEDPA